MASNSEMREKLYLALQHAKSDTEKFAALLLVTKVIKGEDCDGETRKNIFNAIGFDFINRLFITQDVPEDCPMYIYKAIALTLLSCFSMDADIIPYEEMRAKVPDFIRLISTLGGSSDEQIMIDNSIICLSSIVNSSINDVTICREILPDLVEIVVEEKYGFEKCIDLISNLSQNVGKSCWIHCMDSFDTLMNKFSSKFVNNNSEFKFILCRKLAVLVSSSPYEDHVTIGDKSWWREIRKGLSDILFSKLSRDQREPALKLTSVMIEKFGIQWAVGDKNEKFFLIFSHLTCIEVRMIVEDRNLQQIINESSLLTSCFISLENIIAFLVNNNNNNIPEIEFSQKQQLYSSLTGAMNGVLYFISNEARKIDLIDTLPEIEKNIILSCVRVIGAWLAEETCALREDVYAILPFIGKVAVYEMKLKNFEIFRFLLPGLCHLTAEDEPRKMLMAIKFQEFLYKYMQNIWELFIISKDEDKKDSLITTCGVFMNVIVSEPNFVTNDVIFCSLLKFIFHILPQLENKVENLTLIGNLSVIGLLLMRHYVNKVEKCECSMFFISSVKFFCDINNFEKGNDNVELWFIGIQAFCTVFNDVSWIGDLMLKNGWISLIVRKLRKIEAGDIDINIVNEYENFLCCLLRNRKDIQKSFMKDGGIEISTIHNMKELEKLLSV